MDSGTDSPKAVPLSSAGTFSPGGLVGGRLMLRTLSRIICRIVLRKALRKSAVLQQQEDRYNVCSQWPTPSPTLGHLAGQWAALKGVRVQRPEPGKPGKAVWAGVRPSRLITRPTHLLDRTYTFSERRCT